MPAKAGVQPIPGSLVPQGLRGAAPSAVVSVRAADVVVGALLLALGGLVIGAAVRMGIGWGTDGPESGFVPFWLAVILVVSCAAIIVRAVRRASQESFVRREPLERVLKVALPAAAMIGLTPFLGLYVSGLLYVAAYMRWGGRHSWLASVAVPLAVMVLAFAVFERWFLVPLPKGPLEAWLGY